MHSPNLLRTLLGLDFDGIAGKLEALGRLCSDVIAAASAIGLFLSNGEHALERHPRLKRMYIWTRHAIATVALDSAAPVIYLGRRLIHRNDSKKPLSLSASAAVEEPVLARIVALIAWVVLALALISLAHDG